MKYTSVVLVGLFLSLGGCSASQPGEKSLNQPELVSMTSLPALTSSYAYSGLKLNVLFQIRNDGSVADVKMLGTNDNSEWDLAAIDSMKQWRFTAAPSVGSHENQWLRTTIIVQVQEPTIVTLGELKSGNQQEADSLYALLENGIDFESLARQTRPGTTTQIGRFLGSVELSIYPHHVRLELQKLSVNNYTRPIRIGTDYVIYKRFRPDGSRGLQQ